MNFCLSKNYYFFFKIIVLFLIVLCSFYPSSAFSSETNNCNFKVFEKTGDYFNDKNYFLDYKFSTSWYKVIIDESCFFEKNKEVGLMLKSRNTVTEIYTNDFLIFKNKKLPHPLSNSWNSPLYFEIPKSALKKNNNFLLIKIVGLPTENLKISEILIGDYIKLDKIYQKEWKNIFILQILNFSFTLTLGILSFFIWFFRRKEVAFGWFSLTSFCWSILMIGIIFEDKINFLSNIQFLRINIIVFFCYCAFFCFFTWRFANKEYRGLESNIIISIIILSFLLFLLDGYGFVLMLNITFLGGVFLIIFNSFYFPIVAYKNRTIEVLLLGFLFFTYLIFGVFDLFLLFINNEQKLISPYAAPVTALFITVILALRLSNNVKKIEGFNSILELKINQVKEELTTSLIKQHKLALENTILQERIKLAHDLHDSLGGSLVQSIMIVSQDENNIKKQQFLSILKSLRDDLRQIIDNGSSIDKKIPETPLVLFASVRHRFSQLFEQLNINSEWKFPEKWLVQPTSLECLTYLRVTNEALTNVLKHSNAKNVLIFMEYCDTGYLNLCIKDDGMGFNVDAVKKSNISIGLKSMETRLEKIGAKLSIQSTSQGTQIKIIKNIENYFIYDHQMSSNETKSQKSPWIVRVENGDFNQEN